MTTNEITTESNPLKIGGWLLLLAVGIIISPIRILINLSTNHIPILINGAWEVLTTEGTKYYIPGYDVLFITEMTGNMVLLGLSIYMLYLFFTRHYSFPKWYVGVNIFVIVYLTLNSLLASMVMSNSTFFDKETTLGLLGSLIGLAIWGTYLFKSQRSKNTFMMKNGQIVINNNQDAIQNDVIAEESERTKSGMGITGIIGLILGIVAVKVIAQLMS